MPLTWNILTLLFAVLCSRTNVGLEAIRFYSTSAREILAIGVLVKLARAGVRKKIQYASDSPRVSREERNSRRVHDETMTIGRESERRSLVRRRRRAPRRRKLVSCFVAKVKTVTLLSALLVAAPLVCERANAGAGQAKLKHRRGCGPPSPDRNYIP